MSKINKSQKTQNEDFSLSNPDNYKNFIAEEDKKKILLKYFEIISEYLNFLLDKKNSIIIIISGFETISHVFLILLFYTKNIDLTFHYSIKACCLYCEYIEQLLQESSSTKFCIKIKSYDAILFVYKNTIYNLKKNNNKINNHSINNHSINNHSINNMIELELKEKVHIYKNIIINYLLSCQEYNLVDLLNQLLLK